MQSGLIVTTVQRMSDSEELGGMHVTGIETER